MRKGKDWIKLSYLDNGEVVFCTKTIQTNHQVLLTLLEEFGLKSKTIDFLVEQVGALFDVLGYVPDNPKQAYLDAWNLRRLLSFACRRQKDAHRRGQTPRDAGVRGLFDYIAELRKNAPPSLQSSKSKKDGWEDIKDEPGAGGPAAVEVDDIDENTMSPSSTSKSTPSPKKSPKHSQKKAVKVSPNKSPKKAMKVLPKKSPKKVIKTSPKKSPDRVTKTSPKTSPRSQKALKVSPRKSEEKVIKMPPPPKRAPREETPQKDTDFGFKPSGGAASAGRDPRTKSLNRIKMEIDDLVNQLRSKESQKMASGDVIHLSDESPEKNPSKKDSDCTVPKGVNPDEVDTLPMDTNMAPCAGDVSAEEEDDGVTPTEQSNLRSKRRAASSGKRGRPPKNKGEGKASPKVKAKKTAKPKALPKKPRPKPKKASPKPKPAPRASKKSKALDGDEPGTPPDGEEGGVPHKLGCGRCRYASKGCKTCKNPKYRPHKRK